MSGNAPEMLVTMCVCLAHDLTAGESVECVWVYVFKIEIMMGVKNKNLSQT